MICDAYVLNNGSTVLSERGTADLLGRHHKSLQSMAVTLVEVTAKNSRYTGKKITVYDSKFVESLMRAYAMAIGNKILQKNQIHIGLRCVLLQSALVCSALKTAIEQACGLTPNIQQTVQKQCIILMKQYGLKTSFPEEKLYTKKDIINFLEKPLGTVNSYIKKHNIPHEKIDYQTIKANGGKANHMNGYN